MATALLCCLSVLNVSKQASSVKSASWNYGAAFMTRVQEEFVQDYIDLEVLGEFEDEGKAWEGTLDRAAIRKEALSNVNIAKPAHAANDPSFVPLAEFVKPVISCPDGLTPAPQVVNPTADLGEGRKIPRIVHQTGKTQCLTDVFYQGANNWTFVNHSFYFHDDVAVDNLLFQREWPMFPQIKNSMECLKNAGGAAKADLWRYLVLWEYGGIYTDMDNLPGQLFNATTITPDMDAFFLKERGGWVSQYFFAVSPKHPIMFLAVHDVMHQMHSQQDTGKFHVPSLTGPGATKRAFLSFMRIDARLGATPEQVKKYAKPRPGLYQGWGNRSVLVAGTRATNMNFVKRDAIRGNEKRRGWEEMNITNYQMVNKQNNNRSCVLQLHDKYMMEQQREEILRTHRW